MCSSHIHIVSVLTSLLSRVGQCHMYEVNLLAHHYQWVREKLTVQWNVLYIGNYSPSKLRNPAFLHCTPVVFSGTGPFP